MIRILYSWRVKPGSEEAFVRAWTRGTCTIRETVRGANGACYCAISKIRRFLSRWPIGTIWRIIKLSVKIPFLTRNPTGSYHP